MAVFTGAATALITPMKENGELNYEKMGELIDSQIAGGIDALVICGTTGEASTMSHEEHLETIRFAVQHTAKRVPIIAGAGSNCTETEVYLSKEAKKAGADALLLVSPYYNKATQKGLIAHFEAAAKAVDLPIILYNIPSRTGMAIAPETTAYLVKNNENIVGVKDATGDMELTMKTMILCEGNLDLYSGNDEGIVPIMSVGGKGVISVVSHLIPKETHDMVMKFLNGNVKESAALQLKYFNLIKALFCETNPIPIKKALNLQGKGVGPLRLPLTEMEEVNANRLAKEMKAVGLL